MSWQPIITRSLPQRESGSRAELSGIAIERSMVIITDRLRVQDMHEVIVKS